MATLSDNAREKKTELIKLCAKSYGNGPWIHFYETIEYGQRFFHFTFKLKPSTTGEAISLASSFLFLFFEIQSQKSEIRSICAFTVFQVHFLIEVFCLFD